MSYYVALVIMRFLKLYISICFVNSLYGNHCWQVTIDLAGEVLAHFLFGPLLLNDHLMSS